MSIPLEAMSVATRTLTLIFSKSSNALFRAPRDLSPCRETALIPAF